MVLPSYPGPERWKLRRQGTPLGVSIMLTVSKFHYHLTNHKPPRPHVESAPKCALFSCSMDGIAVHADSATVNLNFWLTPDEANLDPTSGGLVVYPKVPPNRGLQQGAAAGSDHVRSDVM